MRKFVFSKDQSAKRMGPAVCNDEAGFFRARRRSQGPSSLMVARTAVLCGDRFSPVALFGSQNV